MSGASSKEDIVRSLGLTSRNFILLYPWHQILIASLPNVKLDPPDLVLACSQAPFIMKDHKIQTDEKNPEMIDNLYIYLVFCTSFWVISIEFLSPQKCKGGCFFELKIPQILHSINLWSHFINTY